MKPPHGILKINVDGTAIGREGLTGTGGVLRNASGEVLVIFSSMVVEKGSNEAESLAIEEALDFQIFVFRVSRCGE